MMLKGGGGGGAESFKVATKQYLGRQMILEGGGVQNALFRIAAKQF